MTHLGGCRKFGRRKPRNATAIKESRPMIAEILATGDDNGDVILCCMDYSQEYILGNLLTSDYNSLFRGKVYADVKKGLRDKSSDIICRYCERYAYEAAPLRRLYHLYINQLENSRVLNLFHRFARIPVVLSKQIGGR